MLMKVGIDSLGEIVKVKMDEASNRSEVARPCPFYLIISLASPSTEDSLT